MRHTILYTISINLKDQGERKTLFCVSDYKVTGRCGSENDKIANTNWAACLVADNNEENGNCPHGFPKINVPSCGRYGSYRDPPLKNLVCCALSPIFDLKVIVI